MNFTEFIVTVSYILIFINGMYAQRIIYAIKYNDMENKGNKS